MPFGRPLSAALVAKVSKRYSSIFRRALASGGDNGYSADLDFEKRISASGVDNANAADFDFVGNPLASRADSTNAAVLDFDSKLAYER